MEKINKKFPERAGWYRTHCKDVLVFNHHNCLKQNPNLLDENSCPGNHVQRDGSKLEARIGA